MLLHNLRSRCLFCDSVVKAPYSTENRLCPRAGCASKEAIATAESDFFVSLIPDFTGRVLARTPEQSLFEATHGVSTSSIDNRPLAKFLPPISADLGLSDIFAIEDLQGKPFVSTSYRGWPIEFPYERDHLRMQFGMRCGNPRLHHMGAQFGFRLDVLDFSTQLLSGTMKDPRSWAIVNNALEHGIKHLALWTAGNAGYSLAKLVYQVNCFLKPDDRLHVYCIVQQKLEREVLAHLRMWQAHVITDNRLAERGSPLLSEDDVWSLIASHLSIAPPAESRWHVTDGWDGVGIMTYYLLALQVLFIEDEQGEAGKNYDAVVIPVGSGDLFIGFYLAALDLYGGIRGAHMPRFIAAVPPVNIFTDDTGVAKGSSIAGKLYGDYTPLSRALRHYFKYDRVGRLIIDDACIRECVRQLTATRPHVPFPFEPSSIVGLAALKPYHEERAKPRSRLGSFNLKERVLVVNTGCGIMPPTELRWLAANWTG